MTVNVSSWHDGAQSNDSSCILEVGDHFFIKHKSFCFYQAAVPMNVLKLERKVDNKEMKDYGMLEPDVFRRVIEGFEKTPVLSRQALMFIQEMQKNGIFLQKEL